MKRRSLLTAAAGAATALIAPGCRIEKIQPVSRPAENLRIGDRTLEEIREQYRYDLFNDYLPFVNRYVIDHEMGGFMCGVDRNGVRVSQEKRASWEGQGLWVFSFLYNWISKDRGFLEVADRSMHFLRRNKPVGYHLWPETYSREGEPNDKPDARGCSELHIAEGILEYARASGEERWDELSKEILLKVVRLYNRVDYFPSFGREYLGPRAPLIAGPRVQAIWMRLIDISSRYLEDRSDPDVEDVLARSLDAVMNYHFNPDFRLHNEILNYDLSRPENEYGGLVHTGNSIETLRIILYAAARTGDLALFQTAAERFRRHVEAAWDPIFDGVYSCLYNVERNDWDLNKNLRTQGETLAGALFIIERTGADWARDIFGKMYDYVREHFTMQQHGSPLWIDVADRRVAFDSHSDRDRVDIYYHPRHLMLNLLSLDRMLSQGGKASNSLG